MTYYERFGQAGSTSEGAVPGHEHDAGDISGTFGPIRIRGDFYTTNWDGEIPADLSAGADSTATEGIYIDMSAGAAQFSGTLLMGDAAAGIIRLVQQAAGSLAIYFYVGTDAPDPAPDYPAYIFADDDYLWLYGPGNESDLSQPAILLGAAAAASTPVIAFRVSGSINIYIDGSGNLLVPAHITPNDDNTSDLGSATKSFRNLYAYGVYDEGGNLRLDLSEVSYGADDSGGAGYKVLRVPN